MTPFEQFQQREAEYAAKAYELCKDQHPSYNLGPVMDLLRQADALGFDVVRRPPSAADNTGDNRA